MWWWPMPDLSHIGCVLYTRDVRGGGYTDMEGTGSERNKYHGYLQ